MKKLLFILLCASICLISCGSSNERKIKSAFKDYVSTHFDDPKNLDEIVSIDSCDTISIKGVQSLLKELKHTYDSINNINRKQSNQISKSLDNPKVRGLIHRNPFLKEAMYKYLDLSNDRMSLNSGDISIALYGGGKILDSRYDKFMMLKSKTFIQYKIIARVTEKGEKQLKTYYAVSDTLFNNIEIRNEGVQIKKILSDDNFMEFSNISDEYMARIKNAKELVECQKTILDIIKKK